MNFATTKHRIIQYIEYKGISKTDFFKKTSIKRGFLDTDKLKSTVSDIFIAKIIATFPDLNPIWLITGNGNMLKEDTPTYKVSESNCDKLELEIKFLKKEIDMKDQIIELLKNIKNVDDGELGQKVPLPKHKKLKHTHK